MTELDKLIEAVEIGNGGFIRADDWINAWEEFRPEPDAMRSNGTASTIVALEAYSGSLDAALALHEALLPGWWFQTSAVDGWATCYVERSGAGVPEEAPSAAETPARAWLLAILRAYRSVQA